MSNVVGTEKASKSSNAASGGGPWYKMQLTVLEST